MNPDHLFVGTCADSNADMMAKGRGAPQVGRLNINHHLTEVDVLEIHRLYATGRWTQRELGDCFGVSQKQVSNVLRGVYWSHLHPSTAAKAAAA